MGLGLKGENAAITGSSQGIGYVAAFLVSEKNSYMTGTTVEVCGGFLRYI